MLTYCSRNEKYNCSYFIWLRECKIYSGRYSSLEDLNCTFWKMFSISISISLKFLKTSCKISRQEILFYVWFGSINTRGTVYVLD
jgi:hypothetical protein